MGSLWYTLSEKFTNKCIWEGYHSRFGKVREDVFKLERTFLLKALKVK